MSKYKVNGMPWASGIGQDVTDCKTSKDVMKKAGLDYTVAKCDLVAKMPFSLNGNNKVNEIAGDFVHDGNIYRDCPNAYGTYRTDNNAPLGLVKVNYEVVQNRDAFTFFDDAIGEGKAQWQNAGYYGYGHKIFVSAKLPITTKVGNDEITHYLVFGNSHDGSSSVNILFTPMRVICTNMLVGATHSADSYIKIKHTASAHNKINEAADILAFAIQRAKNITDIYQSIATIKMTDKQVMEYIANLQLTDAERYRLNDYDNETGYKKLFMRDYRTLEETNISIRKANQLSSMFEYYLDGIGQQQIAGTGWGAFNAITGYYSNVANLEGEKRVDSLLYGGANRNIYKALNDVMDYRNVA